MSDLTDLAALLVGGGGADKAIAAEDPYLEFQGIPDQIGQLILGANQRDEKTGKPVFSTTDRIIGALLSGIVSGGAHSLSEDYQSRAQDAYQKTLLTALSGQEPTKPEVLPEAIFRDAKKQANVFKVVSGLQDKEAARKYNLERAGKVQDAYLQAGMVPDRIDPSSGEVLYKQKDDLDPASLAKQKKIAEIQAENEAYGLGNENPNSPKVKANAALEEQARNALRTTPIVTNFGDIKANFENMVANYKYNDRASTIAFISSFARVLDPASTVREGEIKNAENTQSFFDSLGYKLSSLIDGTQQLKPTVKQEMVRSAAEKHNTFGGAYSGFLDKEKDLIRRSGGNPENVFGPYDFAPFDFSNWSSTAFQVPGIKEISSGGSAQAAARAILKARGVPGY